MQIYRLASFVKFWGGPFLFKDSPFLAIYRWPLVVNEEPPVSLHTGGKPAQGWPNNQKRTFSPLQCSESFYNSMVAWKMRQTTRYCSLAVITFFALFIFSSVPFCVSFILVFHCVLWVVRITLCNAWLVGASWLRPFHCPFIRDGIEIFKKRYHAEKNFGHFSWEEGIWIERCKKVILNEIYWFSLAKRKVDEICCFSVANRKVILM